MKVWDLRKTERGASEGSNLLFHAEWYRAQVGFGLLGIGPEKHYRFFGWRLGKSPHPLFSPSYYLGARPDVRRARIEPFAHFLKHGWRESSNPHPLFDVAYYLSQKPILIGQDPLTHYLSVGWKDGLRPTEMFDGDWYLKSNPDVADAGWEPLSHYIIVGRAQGRRPASTTTLVGFGDCGLPKSSRKQPTLLHRLKVKLSSQTTDPLIVPPSLNLTRERQMQHLIRDNVALLRGFNRYAEPRGITGGFECAENGLVAIKLELLRHEKTASGRSILNLLEEDSSPGITLNQKIASWGLTPSYRVETAPKLDNPILDNYNRRRLEATSRLVVEPALAGTKIGGPSISILMPVYRTPLVYLERAIISVLGQTYANWELVIVDDFSERQDLHILLKYYSELDCRVKYISLPQNIGIAAATNVALDNSTGVYIGLLDHDDMLTRDALECVAEEILMHPGIDAFYSDECKIDIFDIAEEIFTKPDWSPTLLFNCMYTGHFSVYRSTLVRAVGGFNSTYDFSQDYDLALRIAEYSAKIRHIEKILYGWRMIPGSAAAGGKSAARNTNIAALQAAVDRRGLKGTAVALPTANRVMRDFSVGEDLISIVIPSDNCVHIKDTILSILERTTYSKYEIIVVTNSNIITQMESNLFNDEVKFVAFDEEYNFSKKCNVGAAFSTGKYIVFFNDDVRVISSDWIESLLEYLTIPGVGVVGPKLLYENGRIQHAGMVTGVRRLVGTAFHTYRSATTAHFNFAQSAREVSLICGACLAIPKILFEDVGGFNSIDTGIAHSDVDLCFRVRQHGHTCVYTPYAELIHVGHLSIGKIKKREFKQDKADIYLMRQWGEYCARDPYFPAGMRDLLYIDSQEPFTYFPGQRNCTSSTRDVIIFSHDLTLSGAPKIVLDMVRVLISRGEFVVVISPQDGPMRSAIVEAGGHVIVDPLALACNPNVTDLAKNFDLVIANTAVCWPIVGQISDFTRVVFYLHETAMIEQLFRSKPPFKTALMKADRVLTGSAVSTAYLRRIGFRGAVTEVAYGVEEPVQSSAGTGGVGLITISVLATIEPRKGQDLVVQGFKLLPTEIRKRCILRIAGRPNDQKFYASLKELAVGNDDIVFEGELEYTAYTERLATSDIVVCASRDDTLPLVSLDALAAGKILICSRETGTANYLSNKVSGFILEENDPIFIRDAMIDAIAVVSAREPIGENAKRVFHNHFSAKAFSDRFVAAACLEP